MERKQKEQIIIVVTIIALVLMFIGISYAYFTSVNNVRSGSSIVAVGGKMTIDYQDGNSSLLLAENIKPSNDILIDKTFTLTGVNTTIGEGINMPYTVSIEYQNTFTNQYNDELVYFIKRTDENENISCALKGLAQLTSDELYDFPTTLADYAVGYIEDWSGETYKQEIAKGEFKASSGEQVITFNLKMMFRDTGSNQNYNKGAIFNGKIVVSESKDVKSLKFDNDSWEEIAANVKADKSDVYTIGSEKEVEIDGTSYTVRVANNTTPSECSEDNFLETACGFVVEFVDSVEERKMNSSSTNVGGWPASNLRTYANGDFFNKLPSDLQNVIIDTKVISGHGSDDTDNFTSTDKIYLLSPHEIWEDDSPSTKSLSARDTVWNNTRQLDYYKSKNVTIDNPHNVPLKKDSHGKSSIWWLRSADKKNNYFFFMVSGNNYTSYSANWSNIYFSPAFRIG